MAGGEMAYQRDDVHERTCGQCHYWMALPRPVFGRPEVKAGTCLAPVPVWVAGMNGPTLPSMYEDEKKASVCHAFKAIE
jgi:hypothetical protein